MSRSNEMFREQWTDLDEEMFNQQAEPDGEPIKEQIMPNVDDVYPSKKGSHLKAEDLNGKEIKAKIASYEIVEFPNDGEPEKKLVLKFERGEKTLVLNKTNSRAIQSGFGGEIDDWIGKEIIMFPTTTDFSGKMVDCIRVRPKLEEAEFDDSDIPF